VEEDEEDEEQPFKVLLGVIGFRSLAAFGG
jgi:hypothetical protein